MIILSRRRAIRRLNRVSIEIARSRMNVHQMSSRIISSFMFGQRTLADALRILAPIFAKKMPRHADLFHVTNPQGICVYVRPLSSLN